jgi:hypothetical protein
MAINAFEDCMSQGLNNLLFGDGITYSSNAGEDKEIVTLNTDGSRFTRICKVIWSTEALKQAPLMSADGGVFYAGDVLMTIRKKDLKSTPRPNGVIEIPAFTVWRIVDVIYDYEAYFISLVRNS